MPEYYDGFGPAGPSLQERFIGYNWNWREMTTQALTLAGIIVVGKRIVRAVR